MQYQIQQVLKGQGVNFQATITIKNKEVLQLQVTYIPNVLEENVIGFYAIAQDITRLFKEADDNMYRQKLHHINSNRSEIVQTLMKMLEMRDFITEGHADRLQDIVELMAKHLNLPEYSQSDLRLLAQFHDIGKVGISDNILFKPGPLTEKEYKEMQRHSEIGQRIALASSELASMADWILKHHEWWNGQGYPLGLKEEEIPLECRILAIADAYDAMTSDRPYRQAMSHQEAIKEIKRCARSAV